MRHSCPECLGSHEVGENPRKDQSVDVDKSNQDLRSFISHRIPTPACSPYSCR